MHDPYRQSARHHLDRTLAPLREAAPFPPPDGWLRTIREALGMSLSDVARRLQVTPAAVRQLEHSEQAGTIRLESLERVAAAIGAQLRYVVVPDRPLQQLVDERALAVARQELARVNHTMELEDQRPSDALDEELVRRRAQELIDTRELWREP